MKHSHKQNPLATCSVNVKNYGARGDAHTIDSEAIQDAIVDVASRRGGIICFPPGEYVIDQSIRLPRAAPLILRGSGYAAEITASGALPQDAPIITFDDAPDMPAQFFGIEDLKLARSNDGPVLRHLSPTDWMRLTDFRMRNVHCHCVGRSATNVHLEGLLNCVLESVRVNGGGLGLYLQGSHVTIINLKVPNIDYSVTNGMDVMGGNMVFIGTRIGVCDEGFGVRLNSGALGGNIQFNGIGFEGETTAIQMDIGNISNVLITEPAISSPTNIGGIGLNIGEFARNVRVIGGTIASGVEGSCSVKINEGAREIRLEDVNIWGANEQIIQVPSTGVQHIYIRALKALPAQGPFVLTRGIIGTQDHLSEENTITAGEQPIYRMAFSYPVTIRHITDGHEAQELILLFDNDNTTIVGDGNIQLRTPAEETFTTGASLRLFYDGASWREIGRN
ncbi:MAG: hypothetical protein DYG98_19150 [Haliscomenobacteraceae bacterium CHB4]|nr:hypothetical protein [Saprospiraceae bacterium]MCE7925177.1 hypothetical protein [Haliscomenobacteraceae bacterium CHB4]